MVLLSILSAIVGVLQIILFFKLWGMTNDTKVIKKYITNAEYDFEQYLLLGENEKAFDLVKQELVRVLLIKK